MTDLSYSMIIDKNHKKEENIIDKNIKYVPVIPRRMNFWVDERYISNCNNCNIEFSLFNRKHHCRYCGRIFCKYCSEKRIVFPKYINLNNDLNRDNTYFDIIWNWKKNEEKRVCDKCYEFIFNKISIKNDMKVLDLLNLNIKDYYKLSLVCKKWRTIFLHYMSYLRHLQYKLPDYIYTERDRKILWNNRNYLKGHKNYMLHFIKSIEWNKLTEIQIKEVNKIIYASKCISCWNLMCTRDCNNKFRIYDILQLLYPHINNKIIYLYVIKNLKIIDNNDLKLILSYLIKYIKNKSCENIPVLIDILFKKAKKDINFAFLLYSEIKNQEIGKYKNFLNNISNLLLNILEKNGTIIERSYNTIVHLISQNDFTQSYNKILYPLNSSIYCSNLVVKKKEVKKSFHKPVLFDCYIINKDKKYNKQILVKKDDVRIESIVINIINMMNKILNNNNIDIKTITYNILPFNNTYGLIDIVPNSITIQEIKNKNFSIQNYILEKNPNSTVDEIKRRFSKSCALYCVISYLLGIGDRHLDNIMLSEDGLLFHIDFSFILGSEPKITAPELKIIPEMIDVMGGEKSIYYNIFKEYSTLIFNCLRRHTNIFYIMLSTLVNCDPPIENNKYTLNYIKNQIMNRFMPGEKYDSAEIRFNKIVSRNSSYTYDKKINDYIHENNDNIIIKYSSDFINYTSDILNFLSLNISNEIDK